MQQNRRPYTTLCKRLDLDILIRKDLIDDLNWDVKNNHPVGLGSSIQADPNKNDTGHFCDKK